VTDVPEGDASADAYTTTDANRSWRQ